MLIKSVKARTIKDSRGKYTVEATINGESASCPSGASKGKYEAKTIDAKKAVDKINKIVAKNIIGKDLTQEDLDKILIKLAGKNKSVLGANATTAISMAFCRASSENLYGQIGALLGNTKFSIPIPLMNLINGGVHAKNKLAVQEFVIIPKANNFKDAFEICTDMYAKLRTIIKEFYGNVVLGDEAGFSPPIEKTEHALNLLDEAAKRLSLEDKVKFGIDAAASQFYKNGKYKIEGKKLSGKELQNFYNDLIEKYPIIYIEDPFHEEDWKGFVELTNKVKEKIMVVGDDLLTTNAERIKLAARRKACNTLLLKVNQIGTVTEAMEAAKIAVRHNMNVIVSHRSGETKDSFISDLAVGIGANFIKAGAPFTQHRLSKYQRLLEIEEKTNYTYAGKAFKL